MTILYLEPRSQLKHVNQRRSQVWFAGPDDHPSVGPHPQQKDTVPPGLEEGKECQ